MTCITRLVAVTSLLLMLAMTALAGSAAAQEQLFEVENRQAVKLLQVADDAGFVVKGAFDTGTIPASGAGIRLMWYPKKAALRAGTVVADAWDDNNIGGGSVAFGLNTIANGGNSTALGAQTTTASGGNSTAMGIQTIASGSASTAMGRNSRAEGETATAMGILTVATGDYGTAMGNAALASGLVSTAIGAQTEASGAYSTAMGLKTKAVGAASTAIGANSIASGPASTAIGDRATASGATSVALGYATVASGAYSLAVGFGSKATAERTVAMGDNTTASDTWATALGDHTTAAGASAVAMGSYVTAGRGSFVFGDRSTTQVQTAGINEFLVRAHGGIGFNSGPGIGCDLPTNTGAWACTSSRLAKEGFEDLDGESVLSKLAGLRIQRWNYIGNGAAHVGPFAEDFWAAFGLGEGSTTITTVDADGIALLGVQTLERRTTELRAELASLRAELAAIRHEMAAAGNRAPLPGAGSTRMFGSDTLPIR